MVGRITLGELVKVEVKSNRFMYIVYKLCSDNLSFCSNIQRLVSFENIKPRGL